MRIVVLAAATSALVLMSGCSSKSSIAEEKTEIINLLQASQGATGEMSIDPVVVRTKYSIADWVQGEKGGRALLQKEHGSWKVVTNAGEEMRDAAFLAKSGVPEKEAKALVNLLISSERQVPDERLAKMDGVVASREVAQVPAPAQ